MDKSLQRKKGMKRYEEEKKEKTNRAGWKQTHSTDAPLKDERPTNKYNSWQWVIRKTMLTVNWFNISEPQQPMPLLCCFFSNSSQQCISWDPWLHRGTSLTWNLKTWDERWSWRFTPRDVVVWRATNILRFSRRKSNISGYILDCGIFHSPELASGPRNETWIPLPPSSSLVSLSLWNTDGWILP